MSQAIRLLLVDHNTLLRRCLASTLNRRRDLEVVGDTGCRDEALELARRLEPDIVVIEPDAPEGGPDLIEGLRAELPGAGVLALTHSHHDIARRALLAGARGCVEKSCEPEDLVRAIKQVHAGEMVVGSDAIDSLLGSLNESDEVPAESAVLTEREMDVLRLVADGHTNPEIARLLFITEHTVKGHLAKILGKLGLDNRVQLATYAMQHGLMEERPAPAVQASRPPLHRVASPPDRPGSETGQTRRSESPR